MAGADRQGHARGTTSAPGRLLSGVSALRILLKLSLKSVLFAPGWIGCALRRRAPGVRALHYHRVNPYPRDCLGLVSREITVTPEAFEWQLAYLRKRGYRSLPLADLPALMAGVKPVEPGAIVITFDDGYEDNLLWAAPLLRKYGFDALFFVATDFVGRESSEFWPASDAPGCGRFMTWDQVRALRQHGMAVGSHTCSHAFLTQADPDELQREVAQSRAVLAAELDEAVDWFAYPVGDFDETVENAVIAAGYRGAFTTIPGLNIPGRRITALRRTEVSASDSQFVFAMKLRGALDWLWFKDTRAFRMIISAPHRWLLR